VADSVALRSMRYRKHRDGDHSLCRHDAGNGAKHDPGGERLVAAVLAEFPADDEMSRALALELASLVKGGSGVAAVQAVRALGELVAHQRDGVG
jgi:hypothetical protein